MTNTLIDRYDEPFQVERLGAVSFVDGLLVNPSPTTISATGVVMPIPLAEIRILAEGQEDAAGIYVYTETPVYPVNETAKTPPDVILWGGKRWQVKSSQNRPQLAALAHWKVTAMREDPA